MLKGLIAFGLTRRPIVLLGVLVFVAAGLVLLLVNVISVFPFWPGNIGLVQAGIAVSLAQYGVSYARGFAYGIGLQAIEECLQPGGWRPHRPAPASPFRLRLCIP